MNKKLLFPPLLVLILVFITIPSIAVNTCVNTTQNWQNYQLCVNTGSGIYENGLNYYEGRNDPFGLTITSPSESTGFAWIDTIKESITKTLSTGKVDLSKLGDETTFTFDNYNDFYNLLQQKNAIGNVSLFTTTQFNEIKRQKIGELTTEVVNWITVLIVLTLEFSKMIISVGTVLLVIFLIFYLLPKMLNLIKKYTIKFYMWRVQK